MSVIDLLLPHKTLILFLSTLAITTTTILLLVLLRLAQILPAPRPKLIPPITTNATSQSTSSTSNKNSDANTTSPRRPPPSSENPTHLLIVLGSGGHTAEMLNILSTFPDLGSAFTHRTYLVSSGDAFSAQKAAEFEGQYVWRSENTTHQNGDEDQNKEALGENEHRNVGSYSIVTVSRARRVHQSFLSTPFSTLLSLWDCIAVLRGTHPDSTRRQNPTSTHKHRHSYPDLILTNGPGTGVCVVTAALILRFFGFGGPSSPSITRPGTAIPSPHQMQTYDGQGQMRTIFIESWARVKTLSLSGKILRPLVNRFLVQWPQLAEELGEGVEYIGPLVS